MLISNAVVVKGSVAGELVELLAAEASRRSVRGLVITDGAREVIGELARAATVHDKAARSEVGHVDVPRSETGSELVLMTSGQAADHFGIGRRAVIARLHRGSLRGELVDGRWLIELGGAA